MPEYSLKCAHILGKQTLWLWSTILSSMNQNAHYEKQSVILHADMAF